MLKKLSFIIAIIGISVLLGMFILPAEKIVDLEELEINEMVVFRGVVESERDFGDFKIWKLSAIEGDVEIDFEVICECEDEQSYLDKEVEIIGLVDEFNGKKQVRVLMILEVEK